MTTGGSPRGECFPSALSVSVVVPVYNAGQYLGEALASISEQTLPDFEVLVVDDGSTDDSLAIAHSVAEGDARFQVWTQPNRGGAAARNAAIRAAKGKLIALADADDVQLPERLELQVARFRRDPGLTVLGGAARIITRAGDDGPTLRFATTHGDIAATLSTLGTCINDPTAMFRRDAFIAAAGYREKLRSAYDYDLWLRMLPDAAFANLPEVLTLYRHHADQTTSRFLLLTELTAHAVRGAHLARLAGDGDPLNTWDGSFDMGVVDGLPLSPFDHARLCAGLLYLMRNNPADAPDPHVADDITSRLLRSSLLGVDRAVDVSAMLSVGMNAVRSEPVRALRFLGRLGFRAPKSVVVALTRKAFASLPVAAH